MVKKIVLALALVIFAQGSAFALLEGLLGGVTKSAGPLGSVVEKTAGGYLSKQKANLDRKMRGESRTEERERLRKEAEEQEKKHKAEQAEKKAEDAKKVAAKTEAKKSALDDKKKSEWEEFQEWKKFKEMKGKK